MGVYYRYKKDPEGFRKLVELLESTPMSRRQRMIDVGMQEDPRYTENALQYVLNFQDVIDLPDLELAEVLAATPARFVGLAIHAASDEIKKRFLSKSQPKAVPEIKEVLETTNVTKLEIGAGQMKLISSTRLMERRGYVKTKHIP